MRGAPPLTASRSTACAVPGRARARDRTVGLAGAHSVRSLRLEQIAAEAADRRLRLHTQEPGSLGIEVADVAIPVDGEDALDDAGQHSLGFGFASAQRAGEVHQIAPHVFHGARQGVDLGGAAHRNRCREIALAQAHRCLGEILHRTCHELPEHRAGDYRQQRQHQCGHQQPADQRADLAVDLRGRQPRFDQGDDLTGVGDQREARRIQIELLDMRDGVVTVGEAGSVQGL